jgi:hypothetical protein
MATQFKVIEIPLGFDGLTGSKNVGRILPTQLIEAKNITYEEGTLRKEGGSTKYNTNPISLAATLLTNGDFTTDTDWIKQTGWTISAGEAHCDGSQTGSSNLYQYNGTTVAGTIYKLIYTISDYSAGNVTPYVGGTIGTPRSANGTYTEYIIAIDTNDITFLANVDFVGDIDNVTLQGPSKIIGGWDWVPSSGNKRMIVYANSGDLLKDSGDGTFPVTLKSGLGGDVVPVFVEGGNEVAANNRKLFIFNGANVVQVLSGDGVTTSDLATPPADWSGGNQPAFGLIHEGRLWGAGNANDPHRIYYSDTASHEAFTGGVSGSISVYPGEGEYLIAGVSYKGLIILWKYPKGIYMIDTSDPTVANWKVARINQFIGMSGPCGLTLIDDDVLFVDSASRVQLVSGIREFGNLGDRNLSKIAHMDTYIRDNINLGRLAKVRAVYYSAKGEAHFAVAKSNSIVNDAKIVLDFNRQMPRFRFSDKDTSESLWLKTDSNGIPRLTSGDDIGFVWNLDQETRSKDGSGYEGKFQTPHDDFSREDKNLAVRNKNGAFLEIVANPVGLWDLDVDIVWDGLIKDTVSFSMGVTGAALGSFELDTDSLSGEGTLVTKRRITGGGKRFSMIGRNDEDSQDFSIAKAFLYYSVGDENVESR